MQRSWTQSSEPAWVILMQCSLLERRGKHIYKGTHTEPSYSPRFAASLQGNIQQDDCLQQTLPAKAPAMHQHCAASMKWLNCALHNLRHVWPLAFLLDRCCDNARTAPRNPSDCVSWHHVKLWRQVQGASTERHRQRLCPLPMCSLQPPKTTVAILYRVSLFFLCKCTLKSVDH